jgi:SecD/SecF fusion protein
VSDYFERIERQLVERVTAPSRRARLIGLASGWLVPAVAVLVAVAVVAVFFAVGAPRGTRLSPGSGGTDLAYVARPANPSVPLQASLGIAVSRLRGRLATVRPAVTVVRQGDQVTLRGVTPATRATVEALARPGHLVFYDWEANALTPSGRTVASQLTAQEPLAVTISQGAVGGAGPGAGGGGLSLYRAVRLASRQPVVTAGSNARLSRVGPLYYLFGAPGSPACGAVARLNGTVAPGEHCLLAGPDAGARTVRSDLPAGVSASDAEQLVVPQGTVVLQASGATAGQSLAPSRPMGQFYVLRDHGALSGGAITRPAQSTDQSGQPDVSFGFTASGQAQFERATAAIAHRASVASLSGAAGQQNQHFAIALDQHLLSVPSIDFRTYPKGISGGGGADIAGGFTHHAARELAAILRTGPLPVDLIPIGRP